MSNKKQSSVEWLMQQIALKYGAFQAIAFYEENFKEFEQAKAMHEEEIKDAISVGYNMATPSEPYENLHKGDKYYNQKFGETKN